MFFSPELLTIRRKGKFAKCWLAANLSETLFLKKVRRGLVAEINVAKTCENIMVNIVSKDSTVKFSLSLSSNLMLGVARILLYQTKMCLQYQFALQKSIIAKPDLDDLSDKPPKRVPNLPVEDLFPLTPPDVPLRDVNFTHNRANEADITIVDIDEIEMQAVDQVDFGALTDEQIETMLANDGLSLFPTDSIRALPGLEVSLPEIEGAVQPHVFKRPDARQRKEKSLNGIGAIKQIPDELESFVDVLIAEPPQEPVVDRPLGTPSKHKLSPPSQVGTPPIKRRNLGDEFGSGSFNEPIPIVSPVVGQVRDVESFDESMVFRSLTDSVIEIERRLTKRNKKKISRVVADEITQIPLEELRNNVRGLFHQPRASTAHGDVIQIPLPSAEKLFTNPSVGKSWAKSLLLNYEMMILEPLPDRKSRGRRGPSTKDVRGRLPVGETVRKREDTSAQERSGEISNKTLRPGGVSSDDASTKERTNTLDHISIEEPPMSRGGRQTFSEEIDQAPPDLPGDIPLPEFPVDSVEPEDLQRAPAAKTLTNLPKNIRNIIREWSEYSQDVGVAGHSSHGSSEKSRTVDVTSTRFHEDGILDQLQVSLSSSTSQPSGTSREILDLIGRLESLWADVSIVAFKVLCPVDRTTKKEATRTFVNLLELHRIKEVKLTQETQRADIYIQKYLAEM